MNAPEMLADLIRPNVEAAAFIRGKTPVSRDVFDRMLPELRARCFVITGIESANAVQKVRDRIAEVPEGADWNTVRKDIAETMSPWLDEDAAARRADLLLRAHGFQAYQATQWNLDQQTKDTHPYYLYRTAEDDAVRDSHAALDGIILPIDDPFWQTHYPPWDWGCRCEVIAISEDDMRAVRKEDEARPPDQRKVIEGARLDQLHQGWIVNGPSARIDVRPAFDRGEVGAFKWNPGDLRISLEDLSRRYDDDVWSGFADFSKRQEVQFPGTEDPRTVWSWLMDGEMESLENQVVSHSVKTGDEAAIAISLDTARRLEMIKGTSSEVNIGPLLHEIEKGGSWSIVHCHPDDSGFSSVDVRAFIANMNVHDFRMISEGGEHILIKTPDFIRSGRNGDEVYAGVIARRFKKLYDESGDEIAVMRQIARETGVDYVTIEN